MYIFDLLINYVHSVQCYACMYACNAGQKKASECIIDGCDSPSRCWELYLGPLVEQLMLFTSEPSLQLLLLTVFNGTGRVMLSIFLFL